MVDVALQNESLINDLILLYESYRAKKSPYYRVPNRYYNTFVKVSEIVRNLNIPPAEYIRICFEYYKPVCYVNMLLKPPPIIYNKDYRNKYKYDLILRLKSQLYILKEQLKSKNLLEILEDPNNEFSVILKYILYNIIDNPKAKLYEQQAKLFLQDEIYNEVYDCVLKLMEEKDDIG